MADEPKTEVQDAPESDSIDSDAFSKMSQALKANLMELRQADPDKFPMDQRVDDKPPVKQQAPPPEPKKEEPKPGDAPEPEPKLDDDDEPLPAAIKTPKASEEFRNLKRTLKSKITTIEQELAATKAEREKFKTELEVARKNPAATEEIKALQAKHDALVQELEKVSLERSPAFRQKWDRRLGTIAKAAEALAADNAGVKEQIVNIMKMPRSPARKHAVASAMEMMDATDQMALSAALIQMDTAREEMEGEIANHSETVKHLEAQAAQAHEQQLAANRIRAVAAAERAIAAAKQNYDSFKPGDEKQNAWIAEAEADIKRLVETGGNEAERVNIPVLAADGIWLRNVKVPALEAKVAELEKQVKEMTRVSPGVRPRTGAEGGKPTTKGDPNSNPWATSGGSEFLSAFNKARQGDE